uniref:Putative secreted protein n=1 Tax=Ixodes ricinus TaxID=34613 RepID=A0A6B0UR20_IXORI
MCSKIPASLLVLAPFVGADVRTARTQDGCCWAVLVVTDIMRRTQQLAAASEVVFMDSTSSTDGTQSTTTVLLAATKAGAIPLAVLLHNCQSTDSYVHAFHLLKSNYPDSFGGAHVSNLPNAGSREPR